MSVIVPKIVLSTSIMEPDDVVIRRAEDVDIEHLSPFGYGELDREVSHDGSISAIRKTMKLRFNKLARELKMTSKELLSHVNWTMYWFIVTDLIATVCEVRIHHGGEPIINTQTIDLIGSEYFYISIKRYERHSNTAYLDRIVVSYDTRPGYFNGETHVYKIPVCRYYDTHHSYGDDRRFEQKTLRELKQYRKDPDEYYRRLIRFVDYESYWIRDGDYPNRVRGIFWSVNGKLYPKGELYFDYPGVFYGISHSKDPVKKLGRIKRLHTNSWHLEPLGEFWRDNV